MTRCKGSFQDLISDGNVLKLDGDCGEQLG